MIATKSPLFLREFTILKSICEVIPFAEDNVDIKSVLANYPIDIDFGRQDDAENNINAVYVKVTINPEKCPGYSIYVEGVGIFSFEEKANLSSDEKNSLIQYSGVTICITNLRAYVANITAYYPFGKFNFATIDMIDLMKQKKEQQ